jgi:hypothetical protein
VNAISDDNEEEKEGMCLEYSFLEIKNFNGSHHQVDESWKVNVWTLGGHPEQINLLNIAINAETIMDTIVIVAVDFGKVRWLCKKIHN